MPQAGQRTADSNSGQTNEAAIFNAMLFYAEDIDQLSR